jgi:N-acetylglucosaminyldiphosphoundecaprenol N-acetyl-beta-D-mannosaminyltransferase
MARGMDDAPQRVRLLGGEADLVTPAEVLRFVERAATDSGPAKVVANHNAHSLFLLRRSETLRRFFASADLIEIDSVPMIAWGRLLGLPISRAHRATYLDWRDDFWRLADQRGWRVFYLGGAPGVAEEAAKRLAVRYPNAAIAQHHGYFDQAQGSQENQQVVARLNAFDPDVVMVGMGMPLQETWVLENRACIRRGAILTVGAAFDYEAGAQKAAPRWTGRLGVEWLARLAGDPKRLAHRYLIEPWSLIGPALDDLAAARRRLASH